MLFPSAGGYMLKNTGAVICLLIFSNQFLISIIRRVDLDMSVRFYAN